MKLKFFIAAAALVACSSAWAEVVYLDCKTTNPDATDRVYVVDTQRMTGSVHYDYGYVATGNARVTAGSFQLTFGPSAEVPEVEISRVSGKYRTEFMSKADSGECVRAEKPNFKF